MKILVVDDDSICRMVMRAALASVGEVDCCADGDEAVAAFRQSLDLGKAYDLVCMDIMMPKMNGLEALALIRQEEHRRGRVQPHASIVIMTTAVGDPETIGAAFSLCEAYLVKPIHPHELQNLVECLYHTAQPASADHS
jgi:two-component system, chemotaxis family, chemotaxis protein CheY